MLPSTVIIKLLTESTRDLDAMTKNHEMVMKKRQEA
jgi:hypothetical protein